MGWPECVEISIGALAFAVLWTGWPTFINVDKSTHNYYNSEEEDEE